MGLRHREHRRSRACSFIPESILTTSGMALLRNWVSSLDGGSARRGAGLGPQTPAPPRESGRA